MSSEKKVAGDGIPTNCTVIEVHVAELKQLFNSIDPSPFRNRDLDPRAEDFIVDWSKEVPPDSRLALLVHLDRPAGLPDEAIVLREAIQEFFRQRAVASRRRLRHLFRIGRTSLAIGVGFLAVLIAAGDFVARWFQGSIAEIVRESFLIGGWVSMWRPLEVFLYDWWPIRREARNYDRLALMPVRIEYAGVAPPEAWRRDWPAASTAQVPQTQEPSPHTAA